MSQKLGKEQKFLQDLSEYQASINIEVDKICDELLASTENEFGEYPTEAVKAFCELLRRGGKRVRGALAIVGYKMLGGNNESMAIKLAAAVEMLHAYILMVDDIQDRSQIRRGGPTGHIILRDYHSINNLKDDSAHFGHSIAMNGFLVGVHSAINKIADLPVSDEIKIAAIKNVNKNFIATAHGQTLDIFNEVVEEVSKEDVDNVLIWKTAFYTFTNPLQLGGIIAGAKKEDLDNLVEFSLHAGRVFQITDDVIGIFSSESGKDQMDDIKEGKKTILTVYALQKAPEQDAELLNRMLGNHNLTNGEFERCKQIIKDSGALKFAQDEIDSSAKKAKLSLNEIAESGHKDQVVFLEQLIDYLVARRS